jgi:formate--tetrahydrofolate ligase
MLSDLEIAQKAKMQHIRDIAAKAGIREDELEYYGNHKAKVKLSILDRIADAPQGKYIDVTAITPTPLGEGKTVTTIGLSQALGYIGKTVFTCMRQPSQGPVFGIKGGAAGGGYSQVLPMEDINLHLTGDIHAIGAAHNLCAAFLDNHLRRGNKLGIDPPTVQWRRVLDINDKWALNDIVVGLMEGSFTRRTGFDVTVASELMAILALSRDIADMRKRIASIILADNVGGRPVTTEDLKVAGAMTALMKDTIKPNLCQTIEGTPAFVHAGPFGNIAHGNSSIVADLISTRLAEFTVTESGFAADLGMEKFFNIKCRASGLIPNAVVIVASIRALKAHSGRFKVAPGRPLDPRLTKEDLDSLAEGCSNLEKQIENVALFGIPAVVAVNRFTSDTPAELELVAARAKKAGAHAALVSEVWAKGGRGGAELAEAVVDACKAKSNFRFLYQLDMPIKAKIETICTKVYGAKGVDFSPLAAQKIKKFTEQGYGGLPICLAKTHLSLSHDAALKGRPTGFVVPVRDVRCSAGAGFIYPICGEITTIAGLPTHPAGESVDIDGRGEIVGLF